MVCDACFADLELHRKLIQRLQAKGPELFAPERRAEEAGRIREYGRPQEEGSRTAWWSWILGRPFPAAGAAFALALLAFIVFFVGQSHRHEQLRGLWTPLPHPYLATELRGGAGSAEFRQGIELYEKGGYEAAAERLEQAARLMPSSAEVHFYWGVSLLLSGHPKESRRALQVAVERTPSSNIYQWYLAQAQLQTGHLGDAESLLERVRASRGEYAAEADTLLQRIARARQRQPAVRGSPPNRRG
jgi:tetratricopeptide (TPR) repeat protein